MKRKQTSTRDQFPFALLEFWIKPCEPRPGACILCGHDAMFITEIYTDGRKLLQLVSSGMSKELATDTVWSQALKEQLQQKYKRYEITLHCRECRDIFLTHILGGNTAQLADVLTSLIDTGSIAIVTRVNSFEDEGQRGAITLFRAITLADLGKKLRDRNLIVDIPMK